MTGFDTTPTELSRRTLTRTAVWGVPAISVVASAPAYAASGCVLEASVTLVLTVTDPDGVPLAVADKNSYVDAEIVLTNDSATEVLPLGTVVRLASGVSGVAGADPYRLDGSTSGPSGVDWSITARSATLTAPLGVGEQVTLVALGNVLNVGVAGTHDVTVTAHVDATGVSTGCGVMASASDTVAFYDDNASVG